MLDQKETFKTLFPPCLDLFSYGFAVLLLDFFLVSLGYSKMIEITVTYDQRMKEMVMRLQRDLGLEPTGNFGEKEWAGLKEKKEIDIGAIPYNDEKVTYWCGGYLKWYGERRAG